jgi:hypothetical protein
MSKFTDDPENAEVGDLTGLSKNQCFLDGVEFGIFVHANSVAVLQGATERHEMGSRHRGRLEMFFEVNGGTVADIKWINDDLVSVEIGHA